MPLEDLVLMPEPDARRALGSQDIALRVLAPVGHYAGRGMLRVLRVKPGDPSANSGQAVVELVCGYEAYDRL